MSDAAEFNDDLVQRLRRVGEGLAEESADEIEQLRAERDTVAIEALGLAREIEQLRAALPAPRCGVQWTTEYDRDLPFYCEREQNHEGDHLAWTDNVQWADDE